MVLLVLGVAKGAQLIGIHALEVQRGHIKQHHLHRAAGEAGGGLQDDGLERIQPLVQGVHQAVQAVQRIRASVVQLQVLSAGAFGVRGHDAGDDQTAQHGSTPARQYAIKAEVLVQVTQHLVGALDAARHLLQVSQPHLRGCGHRGQRLARGAPNSARGNRGNVKQRIAVQTRGPLAGDEFLGHGAQLGQLVLIQRNAHMAHDALANQ